MSAFNYCPRCASRMESREIDGRTRCVCGSATCGYVFYDNPLPVVAALLELSGSVVLVRSVGWPKGMYGLVTGFLERDESPEEGVLREVHEELGLRGEVRSLIGVYPFAQRNEVVIAYHVTSTGEIVLGAELDGYKLIAPAKLRAWEFGTGLAVRDWLARRAVTPASPPG